jgi:hypothetical protein
MSVLGTVRDIDHADELANRIEDNEPSQTDERVGTSGEAARQRYGHQQEGWLGPAHSASVMGNRSGK